MTTLTTTARQTDLGTLADILRSQHAAKHDIVAPASTLTMVDGVLHVAGAEAVITEDGVTTVDGTYQPGPIFQEGLAAKLDIPLGYLKRMHTERTDLYDANVNGWLQGVDGGDPDPRNFLVRLYSGDGGTGMARAIASDSFALGMDNLDVLMAALQGITDSGVTAEVQGCNLSERRMTVDVFSPQVAAKAPALLAGYRSPFTGQTAEELPLIFAGFRLSNSETGNGAFTLSQRAIVQVCSNGMTMDAAGSVRAVHLGSKLPSGLVRWTADTQAKASALIAARTRDAVAAFLSTDTLVTGIRSIMATAGKPVDNPTETIQTVSKRLSFTEEQQQGILEHFLRSGSRTAGGVMQAVTSFAQTITDPDVATAFEERGVKAMELAAALV